MEEEEVEEPGVILKKRLVCSGREQGLALRWGSCNLAKYALLWKFKFHYASTQHLTTKPVYVAAMSSVYNFNTRDFNVLKHFK